MLPRIPVAGCNVSLRLAFQVQFFLVFVHSAQALIFDCGYPKLVAGLLLLHATIFFVLFSDFYQRAYRKRRFVKELKDE